MRFDHIARILFVAGALAATLAPAPAMGKLVWLDVCDARHSSRKIPLPLDRDERPAGQACHAACGLVSGRRDANRRHA